MSKEDSATSSAEHESLCETLSDFLRKFDGLDGSASSLTEKQLSESAQSLAVCSSAVERLGEISDEIDQNYLLSMESDQEELKGVFEALDCINERVIPLLNKDLSQIQLLMESLDSRVELTKKDRTKDWMKSFLPGFSSKYNDKDIKYHDEIEGCVLHDADSLLEHLKQNPNDPL